MTDSWEIGQVTEVLVDEHFGTGDHSSISFKVVIEQDRTDTLKCYFGCILTILERSLQKLELVVCEQKDVQQVGGF